MVVVAVAGDAVGYEIGRRWGRARWNVLGAFGRAVVCALSGTWFGDIPVVAAQINAIGTVLGVLSVLPTGREVLAARRVASRDGPTTSAVPSCLEERAA